MAIFSSSSITKIVHYSYVIFFTGEPTARVRVRLRFKQNNNAGKYSGKNTGFRSRSDYQPRLHHLLNCEQVNLSLRIPLVQTANKDNNHERLLRRVCTMCAKHTNIISGTQDYYVQKVLSNWKIYLWGWKTRHS